MPDFSMFGPSGSFPVVMSELAGRQAQTENIRANTELMKQNIAQAPLRMSQLAAQTRLQQANAKQAEIETQNAQKMQFLMSELSNTKNSDGTPRSLTAILNDAAQKAADIGMMDQAAKFIKQSMEIRRRQEQDLNDSVKRENTRLDSAKKRASLVKTLLENSFDQASWEANNSLYAASTGTKSPYADVPFSEGLKQRLLEKTMTAYQQADLRLKSADLASKMATRKSGLDFRAAHVDIAEKEYQLRKMREERLSKAGGKPIGVPGRDLLLAAETEVRTRYPNLASSPNELHNAGYNIASRAKALMRANPGVDAGLAIQQATAEAERNHDFSKVDAGFFKGEDIHYKGGGRTPETAKALPKSIKDMVKGMYYNSPKGVIQWDGAKGVLVPNVEPLAQEPDEESDDE